GYSSGTTRAITIDSSTGRLTAGAAVGSGARTELDAAGLRYYDAAAKRLELESTNGLRFFDTTGAAGLSLSSTGGLQTGASGVRRILLDAAGLGLRETDNSVVAKIDQQWGLVVKSSTGYTDLFRAISFADTIPATFDPTQLTMV